MPIRSLLFALTFAFTANLQAAVVSSLANMIIHEATFTKYVVAKNLMNESSSELPELAESMQNALSSMIKGKVTVEKVTSALKEIAATGRSSEDKKIAKEALELLNKKNDTVSKDDLREATNKVTTLFSRYGKYGDATPECLCSKGGTDMADAGILTVVKKLTDRKAKKAARRLRSMGAQARLDFIRKELKDVYAEELPTSVDELPVDVEFALALFFELRKSGGRQQKEFVTALESLMKNPETGKVEFLANGQIIYQVLSRNNTDDFMKSYTKLLKSATSKRVNNKSLSAKEAFEQALKDKAMMRNAEGELVENEALLSKVDYVIKNCPKFTK